jgi:hypothetical protein
VKQDSTVSGQNFESVLDTPATQNILDGIKIIREESVEEDIDQGKISNQMG